MQKYQEEFIRLSVFAKALSFGQFKLKSGRISPYFFNSGVFYTGELTSALAETFAELIERKIGHEKYDIIFGPAYKGIPLAVSVCTALSKRGINKEWCFDRKEAKEHGDKGAFVGSPVRDGQRIIIIDDVFTTGGAKEEAIVQLKSVADVKIAGVFILLDRQEKDERWKNAIAKFEKKHKTKVYSVVSADDVFEYLSRNKIKGKLYVDEKTLQSYYEYKRKYGV